VTGFRRVLFRSCNTGEACGFTDTRSCGRRWLNHNAVMIDTIEADDAWCPPTFNPDGFGRTRLAWWMIALDNHSTRSSIARRTSVVAGAVTDSLITPYSFKPAGCSAP